MPESSWRNTSRLTKLDAKKWLRKIGVPLLILLLAAVAVALFSATGEPPPAPPSADRAPVVSVQVVSPTTASPMLRVFGQVESPRTSVLTAGIEADVVAIKALEGAAVQRGQEMMVLDDADAALVVLQRRSELAEAAARIDSDHIRLQADQTALQAEQALLALARRAVQRAEQLARTQAGSEAALDQTREVEQRRLLDLAKRRLAIDEAGARRRQLQARRQRAAAALKQAERAQARSRVLAPFTGRVLEVLVSEGDRVAPNSPLLRMYDDSQLEVRAQVPAAHLPALRQAVDARQAVTAAADANGAAITLTLHRLAANVVAGQSGIDGFFRVAQGPLPALGEALEMHLELPPVDNVVLLPTDSLYGNDRVFRVRDGVLQAIEVRRLGLVHDGAGPPKLIIAAAAFAAGDQVLNSRLPQAVDGLKVRVAR